MNLSILSTYLPTYLPSFGLHVSRVTILFMFTSIFTSPCCVKSRLAFVRHCESSRVDLFIKTWSFVNVVMDLIFLWKLTRSEDMSRPKERKQVLTHFTDVFSVNSGLNTIDSFDLYICHLISITNISLGVFLFVRASICARIMLSCICCFIMLLPSYTPAAKQSTFVSLDLFICHPQVVLMRPDHLVHPLLIRLCMIVSRSTPAL